uniref:protein O-GlcNAc transferase n=1 Tax=Desulfatirhabdium butyrativorans TaxID=340467 RepID=A0A7C4RUE6_9BACT
MFGMRLNPMKKAKTKHLPKGSGKDIEKRLYRALEAHKAGRLDEAWEDYRRILSVNPAHPDALHLSGMILYARKQFERAVDLIQRAIRLKPNEPMFYYNLGATLHELGCWEEAEAAYRKALSLRPDYAEVYSNLGNTLKSKGKFTEAIASLKRAIELKPDFADAYCNLGAALAAMDATQEAEACYQKALAFQPRSLQTWHNYGNLFRDRDRFAEAHMCFKTALEIDPSRPESLNNLGQILMLQGDAVESLRYVKAAWDLKPDYWAAGSNWLLGLHYPGTVSEEDIFSAHRQWAKRVMDAYPVVTTAYDCSQRADDRIHIGYVSADFRTHSVAYFIEPILTHHDRSRFHITAYSDTEKEDETTDRLRGLVDSWKQTSYMKDETLIETIRRDGIDILVDLGGHTAGNRLVMFARKPAPIQVTYIGYPDTTGLDTMDYRITDAWADPPGMTDLWHTETLVRLKSGFLCYRPSDHAPEVGASPFDANGYITFGSFNNLAKVSDTILHAWAKILALVPNSRLLLKARPLKDPQVCENVLQRLQRVGIDPHRVVLQGALSHKEHLARYGEVDIALDTFPYHGTTTTFEALWMGVPVVTASGKTHVSRVGCSILHRIGMEELIASSLDAYVAKATELALDTRRLVLLRQGMRHRIRASTLIDGRSVTGSLEEAYLWMMENRKEGR